MLEMVAELTTGTVSDVPLPVLAFVTEPVPLTTVLTLALLSGTKSVAGPVVARYIAPEVGPEPVLHKVALLVGATLPGPFEVALSVEVALKPLKLIVAACVCDGRLAVVRLIVAVPLEITVALFEPAFSPC